MILKYTNYADGIHDIQLKSSAESLKLSETFFGEVVLNAKMDKSPGQIVLSCELIVNTKFACDRCTAEYEEIQAIEFQLVYIIEHGEESHDDDEDRDNDVYYITPETDKINLANDLKDYAELSLPMKKLCDDDCKGLCLKCGANLNESECNCKDDEINPVWEPLLKLKDKLNK